MHIYYIKINSTVVVIDHLHVLNRTVFSANNIHIAQSMGCPTRRIMSFSRATQQKQQEVPHNGV